MTKEHIVQSENEWYESQDMRFDALVLSKGFEPLWNTPEKNHMQQWLGEPVMHTAETVCPWPGAIPALLTGHDERSRPYVVAVGAITALLYMHDDLVDGRDTRCGVETALGRYGEEACRDTVARATGSDVDLDISLFPSDVRDGWTNTIAGFQTAQQERKAAKGSIQMDTYFAQTARRLGFIEQWWAQAAASTGDTQLAAFLLEASPLNATACQIRNDVRNTQAQEVNRGGAIYSDFCEGKMTAVTIGVLDRLDRLDQADRIWFEQRVWGKQEPINAHEVARLNAICSDTEAVTDITGMLDALLGDLDQKIQRAPLAPVQKLILRAHAARRYASGILPDHPIRDPNTIKELETILQ